MATPKTKKRTASQIGKSNVSRSKSHERNVAKWLTEWAGVEFRRRRVTGNDNATRMLELTADVIPIQGDFLFSIEAKCGRGFSFDSLLTNIHTCRFTEWWHQTCYDAQFLQKDRGSIALPMLFFKPLPMQNWVAISSKAESYIKNLDFPHLRFNRYGAVGAVAGDVSHTKKPKIVKLLLDDVIFCRWKDFADNVDPKSVLTL